MGGLLAARALAGEFQRVTVLERDELSAMAEQRRGVPQGRHFHTILRRGAMVLDELFPGFVDELAAEGAPTADLLREATFVGAGHVMKRVTTGATTLQLTRPMLEAAVRDRVVKLPGVTLVDGVTVTGLISRGPRVLGVRLGDEELRADLVVDASGRSGRAMTWLETMGYHRPAEEQIKGDIVYVSRLLRLADGAPRPEKLTLVGPMADRPIGFALAAQEGDRWMLTVVGMVGDHPPTDDAGLLAFLARCAPPEVYEAIAAAEPLSEPSVHRFPASRWRHYERLRDFPDGLLVFGDAICSFNPVYGQGMTVAALEADALRRCLRDGDENLARRFFRAAAGAIGPVWLLNAVADLAIPAVEGRRTLATRVLNRYVTRVQVVASHDPVVATAFMRAIALLTPPTGLMRPDVAVRVLRG